MRQIPLHQIATLVAALSLLGGCDANTKTADGGTNADTGGSGDSQPSTTAAGGNGGAAGSGQTCGRPLGGSGAEGSYLDHIPTPLQCCPSGFTGFTPNDGGVVTCSTNVDCSGHACVDHQCTLDDCLSDTDCPAGTMCYCGQSVGAPLNQGANHCVATRCRTDSDCSSGLCSPQPGSNPCGLSRSRFCRTAADTCHTNADCAASCQYIIEVAHWQCTTAYGPCAG
jgi:hypothetical protein